jgi:drug/metabolite transporter (DMT)-like permease
MGRREQGLASGISAAAIWGAMYVVSKALLDVIPPFTLLSMRLVLGAIVLFAATALQGVPRCPLRSYVTALLVGLVGFGVSLGFQFVGTQASTAANGALVTSATPAFVFLLSGPLLHERVTTRRVWALLLSSLGVLAVIDPRSAQFDEALFRGNLYLVAAAVTWALYSVLVRRFRGSIPTLTYTAVALLGGLPIGIPLLVREGAWASGLPWSLGLVAGILFLGIICTALAMYLWNRAFVLVDAGTASLTFFAQPVVGALLGMAFLSEQLSPAFLLGGLLIGVGLVLASRET